MKKIVFLLSFCLLTFSTYGQDRFSYSLEAMAGVGVGRGPRVVVTPQFVAQYEFEGGLRVGAGVGARFAQPCVQYITRNGSQKRTFCNEFDIPLFLRLGYGKERLFANVDAGYAVSVLSFYGFDWIPGGKKNPCYDGFFVDPHVGVKLGRHSALALGVLLQQSVVSDHVHTENGSVGDPDYSISGTVTTQKTLTPAITLRYAFLF